MIGFALGILRLPPDAFWSMSLPELSLAIAAVTPLAPLDRSALEEMMRRFPDGR